MSVKQQYHKQPIMEEKEALERLGLRATATHSVFLQYCCRTRITTQFYICSILLWGGREKEWGREHAQEKGAGGRKWDDNQ